MTTNPFWPQYTEHQQARIAKGRKRQIERWNTKPFKAQPSFRVVHHDEELTEGGCAVDVFRAKNAPSVFAREWRSEVERHGFVVEHTVSGFYVLVPHTFYLNARWLPVSVDRHCCLNSTLSLAFVAVLVRIAYMLLVP